MTAPTEAEFRAAVEADPSLALSFDDDEVNDTMGPIEAYFDGLPDDPAYEIWNEELARVRPAMQAAVRPLLIHALTQTGLRFAAKYPDALRERVPA